MSASGQVKALDTETTTKADNALDFNSADFSTINADEVLDRRQALSMMADWFRLV